MAQTFAQLVKGISATNAPANSLTIDSSGRVGIGTTSPAGALDVGAVSGAVTTGDLTVTTGSTTAKVTIGRLSSTAGDNTAFRIRDRVDRDVLTVDISNFIYSQSGSERARIDSSGRLLVGTSSARTIATQSSAIQNEGTSFGTTGFSTCRNSNDVYGPYIHFGKTRGASVGSNTIVASGDDLGGLIFGGADGTDVDSQAAYILCQVDGTPGANDMPGRLVFSTTADGASSPTERMRIANNGQILAGTTDATNAYFYFRSSTVGDMFHAWSDSASFVGSTLLLSASRNTSNSTYNFLTCARQGAAYALYIRDSGNVQNANNSYTGISDAKLKENVVDANSQWTDIKALRVRNYNFKEETGHPTHKQIGLIAQEVEEICPHLVDEAPDRDFNGTDLGTTTKGVNYSVLYMKAVKALQEAMERIETLEAKVAALEAS